MSYIHKNLWEIYEAPLDEAAFLWGQWEGAMDAANYTLEEVIAGPEERLRAHLDGLVLGGKAVAEKLLVPALADDDPGRISAAAWVLLQGEDTDRFEVVFAALSKAGKREVRGALGRAFELAERTDLAERLRPMLAASPPTVQAVIVDVLSGRLPARAPGQPPRWGFPIEVFLESRHQDLQAAALRAVCRAPDPAYVPFVEKPLASPYLLVRDVAIEAGIQLNMRAARTACAKLVARNAPGARLPLAVMAVGGEPVDVATVIRKLDVEDLRRDALWALGFAGTAAAAEAVLAWVGDGEVDKVAGEAFATITGARITGPLAQAGESDNSPPKEDEDERELLPVVQSADSLPSPHAEHLFGWWNRFQGRFSSDVRYLYGAPQSAEAMTVALTEGPTWRRRAWNLALSAGNHAGADLRTWARHQPRKMA